MEAKQKIKRNKKIHSLTTTEGWRKKTREEWNEGKGKERKKKKGWKIEGSNQRNDGETVEAR